MDFVGFLSMVIYVVSLLYTQCLRYNICRVWFLDIRISTCLYMKQKLIKQVDILISKNQVLQILCLKYCVHKTT